MKRKKSVDVWGGDDRVCALCEGTENLVPDTYSSDLWYCESCMSDSGGYSADDDIDIDFERFGHSL